MKEPRNPGVHSVRVLHSTEKTQLSLQGEHQLVMVPDSRLLLTDFRRLRVVLPFTAHLRGIVVGQKWERLTNKGDDQICFTLMDRQHRSVACIAHAVSCSSELFTEGKELVVFYARGQEGLQKTVGAQSSRKTPGNVWLFGDSYVLQIASVSLPGVPTEEIRLMS